MHKNKNKNISNEVHLQMEKAKPFFLTGYIAISLSILLFAVFQIINNFHLAWVGLALATGVYPFYVGLVLSGVSKKSIFANLGKARLFTALGVLLTIVVSYPLTQNPIVPLVLAGLGIALFIIYMRWYSIVEKKSPSISVDERLPMFNLKNIDGTKFNSMTLFDTTSVLVFYRGNWCPFCVSQVTEFANNHAILREYGIQLLFISSQPRHKVKRLADRFRSPCTFLYDKNNELAKEWNIDSQQSLPAGFKYFGYQTDTVLPTLIITNKKRRIVFLEQTNNYRIRPLVEDLIDLVNSKTAEF